MMCTLEIVAANDLGDFLRARRGGLRPRDVGLPAGTGIRRTPGLRREELAALAGLSIDYYIRLEQGKETNPSGQILTGLARALRLDDEERAHLYALADHAAGRAAPARSRASRVVRPGISQLLAKVRPYPAYLLTRTSDLLAANPEALALFCGITDWPEPERNTIRYTFCHPAARELFADWEEAAASTAAHLRALAAAEPGAAKPFNHPEAGSFTLTFEVLHLDEGQRVTIYLAEPGTRDHDALTLLAMTTADPR